jgi:hypothetical protein
MEPETEDEAVIETVLTAEGEGTYACPGSCTSLPLSPLLTGASPPRPPTGNGSGQPRGASDRIHVAREDDVDPHEVLANSTGWTLVSVKRAESPRLCGRERAVSPQACSLVCVNPAATGRFFRH